MIYISLNLKSTELYIDFVPCNQEEMHKTQLKYTKVTAFVIVVNYKVPSFPHYLIFLK